MKSGGRRVYVAPDGRAARKARADLWRGDGLAAYDHAEMLSGGLSVPNDKVAEAMEVIRSGLGRSGGQMA